MFDANELRSTIFWVLLSVLGLWLPTGPAQGQPAPVIHLEGVPQAGWYAVSDLNTVIRAAGGEPVQWQSAPLKDGNTVRVFEGWAIVRAEPQDPALAEKLGALGGKLPVNRATAAQLERLPGVGPVLAQRIVDGRPYRRLEDLDRVKGIGPKSLQKLANWLEF